MEKKKCNCCEVEFPIGKFAFKNKEKGKRVTFCDECRKVKSKESYYKHHSTNLARAKKYKKENKEWFFKLKETLSCCICGESETSCLDFHHMNSNEKDFNISNKSEASKKQIVEEINKCACLCANCHRKHHAGKLFGSLVKLNITQSYEV